MVRTLKAHHCLPLSTIQLVRDNREYEVFFRYISRFLPIIFAEDRAALLPTSHLSEILHSLIFLKVPVVRGHK